MMQILVIFLGLWAKKLGGGLTPKGKIMMPAHFVFQSYWVVPSTWQSFMENEEMACITSAWSSRKLGLNKDKINAYRHKAVKNKSTLVITSCVTFLLIQAF